MRNWIVFMTFRATDGTEKWLKKEWMLNAATGDECLLALKEDHRRLHPPEGYAYLGCGYQLAG